MKVYLQYPWKFSDSPYYAPLIKYPPKNVEYLNAKKGTGIIQNKSQFITNNWLKNIIRQNMIKLQTSLINVRLTKTKEKYDLIHCCHCLSKNKSPWVADFESHWQVWISGEETKAGVKKVRDILNNNYCKKIMPWTDTTKKDILRLYPEIEDKVEVVYPAVPIQTFEKKEADRLVILYVARYFWVKGGLIALETLKRIRKKYDVEVIFVSNTPEEIKEQHKELGNTFLDLMPQKKLFELYKKADIFFYPSLLDTFGFQLLEAISFGLPIISVNTPRTTCRRDLLKDNNGIIFDSEITDFYTLNEDGMKIVDRLEQNLIKVICDTKLREKIRGNNLEEVRTGRFSIDTRNNKLEKIYNEAVKK